MSKFLLSLVLGASAVLAHNHSNGTPGSTPGAPPASDPTSAPTNVTATAVPTSFKLAVKLGVTLPANVTVAGMAAAVPAAGLAYTPTSTCAAATASEHLKSVCEISLGVLTALTTVGGAAPTTMTVLSVAAGRRRSLTEIEGARQLATTAITVDTQNVYASDAALQAAVAATQDTDATTAFATALNENLTGYGTVTVTGLTASDITLTDGTTQTVAEATAANDAANASSGSSSGATTAFVSGVMAMFVAAMAF